MLWIGGREREKGEERKTEVRGEEKAKERNTGDAHSACLMDARHTRL